MKLVVIDVNAMNKSNFDFPPIRILSSLDVGSCVMANEIEIIGPARLRHDPTGVSILPGHRLVLECEDVLITRE